MTKAFITCRQAATLLGLCLFALLASGCATPALWKHTASRTWWPQMMPDQFLATSITGRQEVIVIFSQSVSVGRKVRHRTVAWNPRHPPAELIVGQRALRQLTNACDQVQSMPAYYKEAIPAGATAAPPGYALLDSSWSRFFVHLDGVPSGPFELPVSHEKPRKFMRVAGMPFAIAVDAAIAGAVIAVSGGGINISR